MPIVFYKLNQNLQLYAYKHKNRSSIQIEISIKKIISLTIFQTKTLPNFISFPSQIINQKLTSHSNIIKADQKKMTQQKFKNAYMLKRKATQHMNEKKYSYAMVYLCDALKQFQKIIQEIDEADQMEKVIKQIKLPCHKNLSLCYLKKGNYSACVEQCKEVLEIEQNSVKILYRLGNAYMNMNNLQQAEKYLKQAFFLDPNQHQVMKTLERIQCLRNQGDTKINQLNKINSSSILICLFSLIKFFFLWPFIVLGVLYRKIITEKTQKNKSL